MLPRIFLALLMGLLLTASTTNLSAQSPKGVWRSVETTNLNTMLWVETKDGEKKIGLLTAVSPSGITLRTTDSSSDSSLDRSNIKKVYTARKGSRGRLAGLGALIGGGVGLGLGLLAASRSTDANIGAIFFPIGGAGLGAAIGAASGGKYKKGNLIYEAD